MRKVSRGFTLIELLVVVSIIAVLLSVLVPALRLAKEKAMKVSCLSNLKNIMLGWQMYTVDNDDKLVNGYCWPDYMLSQGGPGCWVEPPQDDNGNARTSGDVPAEYRFNGIRKGLLYPYLDTIDIFHCPGDLRFKKGTSEGSSLAYKMFRTYSVADGAVANETVEESMTAYGYRMAKRIQEIKAPATKYILIEEGYDGAAGYNFNDASWNFSYDPANSDKSEFWDPLGVYHSDSCSISYADGHAESYKFRDNRTVEYFTDRFAYLDNHNGQRPSGTDNEDVRYFNKAWPGIPIN